MSGQKRWRKAMPPCEALRHRVKGYEKRVRLQVRATPELVYKLGEVMRARKDATISRTITRALESFCERKGR